MVYLLKIVIFHSYVSLPEGNHFRLPDLRSSPSQFTQARAKAQPFDVLQSRIEHMLRQQLGGIKSDHASIVKGLATS